MSATDISLWPRIEVMVLGKWECVAIVKEVNAARWLQEWYRSMAATEVRVMLPTVAS